MKFNINPPTGRKEYVNLPEREPDDAAVRDFLGAKMDHAVNEEHVPFVDQNLSEQNDYLADFLSDGDANEVEMDSSIEKETSWRHSKWGGMLFLAALAVLGSIWYLASRAENDLPRRHRAPFDFAALRSG